MGIMFFMDISFLIIRKLFFENHLIPISLIQETYSIFHSQVLWDYFRIGGKILFDIIGISFVNSLIFMGDDRHGGTRDLSETSFRLSQSGCRPEGDQKRSLLRNLIF